MPQAARGAQLDRFLNLERRPPWMGRIPTRGSLTVLGHPGSGAEEAVQRIAHAEHGPSLGIWLDARHYGDRAALVAAVAEQVLQRLLGSETLRRWRTGEPPSTDALAALGSRRGAELARQLTMSDGPQTSPISQVLALPPHGMVLCIGWAHLLAERQMGGLLWELRASVMGGEIALVLSTFPATKTSMVGEQAPLFGIGEELEIADPTTERWREIVRVGGLPVSDDDLLWLLLRTDGQARATAEILALTRPSSPGARRGVRRIWEQESERALAAVGDAVSFARAVNPHGAALMSAIAAEQGPYRALRPYANAKQIARALGQLAYHGLVYSPRRGRWLLGNPLLRDALVDLDREIESRA
ncbi:MAG TPA: hypothetical protein VHS55_05690 [Solirubrobacteraceae bacterium]|jgi:hypothetical protein|nr:hypothetical protein [Solirubrobacteraceae bacterium]